MASALWRGNWMTRTRIATGLFLFVYAFLHFINIGLGLFSPRAMEGFQDARQLFTRSLPGTILLYGSLLFHSGLALVKIAGRRTLRMPFPEALQLVLGLLIPLQLVAHIVFTRLSNLRYGTNDEMGYILVIMWNSPEAWQQSALLLVVWIHGCIGLHLWLRLTRWWQRLIPYMIGIAVLVPAFALAGALTEGRRVSGLFGDEAERARLMAEFNWPQTEQFAALFVISTATLTVFIALLGLAVAIYFIRKILRRRRSVRINYVDGPEVVSERGMTLLEISKAHGVPHTSLCGGKGRCTTCRVVIEQGGDLLHPPSEAEARSLMAVKAPPNTRLACQIRPSDPATVFRVFRPEGGRSRAHASQGKERQLAILFLDMRSFTSRTAGQLPYDVVFLLNRFFDAIVPAITSAGGTIDKYLGDGLLAVFETSDAAGSARAGLAAAEAVSRAVQDFNRKLEGEGDPEIRIGMGLHLGNLVLGEIGAAGQAPRTIIGDTVNVASRLEATTKELGVELLVSAPVLEAAGIEADNLTLTEFELRGVSEPLPALPVTRASDLSARLSPARPETAAAAT